MKNLLITLIVLGASSSLWAQSNETKYKLTNYTPLTFNSFEFDEQLARPIVYNEVTDQFIKLNAAPNLVVLPLMFYSDDGHVLGSIQTGKLKFMNMDVEVQYFYDNLGVLRESSFSLPIGNKKKRSHSFRYVNTQ